MERIIVSPDNDPFAIEYDGGEVVMIDGVPVWIELLRRIFVQPEFAAPLRIKRVGDVVKFERLNWTGS